jgi:site-specific recombinase XerD
MGEKEIAQFLSSLASELHVSASTQNQALNAILFLYRDVLRKEIGYVDGVIRAKKSSRLPVVLTKEEVKLVLDCLKGLIPSDRSRQRLTYQCLAERLFRC